MTNKRVDFTDKVRSIIARRAGYMCSFPGCGRLLIGPAADLNEVNEIGECAHIYAATDGGPRGTADLSPDELGSVGNGIYLCRQHHSLIDRKSNVNRYTPSVLLQMKDRHEQIISDRIGQLNNPLHWVKSIEIDTPTRFKVKKIDLSKLSVLLGNNGTGKSIFIELLYMALTGETLDRWRNHKWEYKLCVDSPILSKLSVTADKGVITYKRSSTLLYNFPLKYDVVYIRDGKRHYDDLTYIGNVLGVSRDVVRAMLDSCQWKNCGFVKSVSIKDVRIRPYKESRVLVRRKGKHLSDWDQPFTGLSDSEQICVILDLVTNCMEMMSQYRPSILLIDWSAFYCCDDAIKNWYLEMFKSSQTHFQTIIATHTKWSDVNWTGWSIVDLNEKKIII